MSWHLQIKMSTLKVSLQRKAKNTEKETRFIQLPLNGLLEQRMLQGVIFVGLLSLSFETFKFFLLNTLHVALSWKKVVLSWQLLYWTLCVLFSLICLIYCQVKSLCGFVGVCWGCVWLWGWSLEMFYSYDFVVFHKKASLCGVPFVSVGVEL